MIFNVNCDTLTSPISCLRSINSFLGSTEAILSQYNEYINYTVILFY